MKITFISDTHTKHEEIGKDLPGGDLIIHAGDLMNSGYEPRDIAGFVNWYSSLLTMDYKHRVFIAGNHDWGFQNNVEKVKSILSEYDTINYLQDDFITVGDSDPHDPNVNTVKIWGSPWQPEFDNCAFNLPRNGEELKAVWDMIPEDIDILITHGPAWGFLDDVEGMKQSGEGLVIGLKYKRPSKTESQRNKKVDRQHKMSPLFRKLEMAGEGGQVHEAPFVIQTNGEKNVVIG